MKMSTQPVDLETMFNEMKTIKEKYNIPKGMLFLPDKIEIILEREETNNFNLTYSESFNYLPEHVQPTAFGAGMRGAFCQQSLWLLERVLPETAAAEARAVRRDACDVSATKER
jgi:hypothetical protein